MHRDCSRHWFGLLLLLPALLAADAAPRAMPPTAPLKQLHAYPNAIQFDSPRSMQRLGVLGDHGDGRRWDYSRDAQYQSANPAVGSVDANE